MTFRWPRICCLCGEGPIFGTVLCSVCDTQMRLQLFSPGWRRLENLSCYSLMSWGSSNERGCRALLYEVKETSSEVIFKTLARELISQLPHSLFHKALFIPLPSSTGRKHSLLLAKALAEFAGGTMDQSLKLVQLQRQPGKKRIHRQKRRMIQLGDLNLQNYKTVFLVDDVVTSGATMEAAFRALTSKEHVLGLSLFNRLLCTEVAL